MAEKLKAASFETLKKINSLKDEIDFIRESNSITNTHEVEQEIQSLEKELIGIRFLIILFDDL